MPAVGSVTVFLLIVLPKGAFPERDLLLLEIQLFADDIPWPLFELLVYWALNVVGMSE